MTSAVSATMTVIIILFKYPLMRLFTEDAEVIRLGGEYLTIVTSFYLIFTTMFVFNGVMRGAGDTIIPMFITLFALWVIRIPAAYFLSNRLGETGIWWAIPAGWSAGMILAVLYYRVGNWKKKVVARPVPDRQGN